MTEVAQARAALEQRLLQQFQEPYGAPAARDRYVRQLMTLADAYAIVAQLRVLEAIDDGTLHRYQFDAHLSPGKLMAHIKNCPGCKAKALRAAVERGEMVEANSGEAR